MNTAELPIVAIRSAFEQALSRAPVVVSAPTGSGKSTEIPRWCARKGPVLVVEPRRVACRGLAARLASLEGVPLGSRVGYSVRDDHRAGRETTILFATPGVVLQRLREHGIDSFATIILDEFHERRLDVDLIAALLLERRHKHNLVIMSATIDVERLVRYVGGISIEARGRLFPIDMDYIPHPSLLPTPIGLEDRLISALARVDDADGDILVFLPGKGEIMRASARLQAVTRREIVPLHGGLSLRGQARVLSSGGRARIILATNIAETSLTVPGVRTVIDSGLVRRTLYHGGRGFLTMVPIARDSADQRAGRAGRLAAGRCIRLWSEQARLAQRTPPEIHRDSLIPLVLAAAACGADIRSLSFLDPPKDYALEAATRELEALRAVECSGEGGGVRISARGRRLFSIPLDPPLANLLIEADKLGCLGEAIDLAAVLATMRPPPLQILRGCPDEHESPATCDALGCIRSLRRARARGHLGRLGLDDADELAGRLWTFFGEPGRSAAFDPIAGTRRPADGACRTHRGADGAASPVRSATMGSARRSNLSTDEHIDRDALVEAIIRADPLSIHILRRRGKRLALSKGGTEVVPSRECAAARGKGDAYALLAFQALGTNPRDRKIVATCTMPIDVRRLYEAGFGSERLRDVRYDEKVLMGTLERVFAGRVLGTREIPLTGRRARQGVVKLFVDGTLFSELRSRCMERLDDWSLFEALRKRGWMGETVHRSSWDEDVVSPFAEGVPALDAWVSHRMDELGLESGEDLELLEPDDWLPPPLPDRFRERMRRDYPRTIDLGTAFYHVHYDFRRMEVVLKKVRGTLKGLPPNNYIPAFRGMAVYIEERGRILTLRSKK